MGLFKKSNDIYYELYGKRIPIMLKLGGTEKHPLWLNYGKSHFFKKNDIELDYMDNTVKCIYIDDLLEMMPNASVLSLLKECLRVLEQYGILRISVRNIMLYHYGRINKDIYVFDHIPDFKKYSINQLFLNEFASQKSQVNSDTFIPDSEFDLALKEQSLFDVLDYVTMETINIEHQSVDDNINWFNWMKLERMLQGLGCKSIFYSYYKQSNMAVMRQDPFDNFIPQRSFFMEVRKS